jgi:hypothetical protein
MAHYARVIDGKVTKVHVLANEVITDDNGVEREELGQVFLAQLHGYNPEELIQCSYNGNIRAHYPSIGFTYDEERDAFIPPKPFESWVLDEATCLWVAPLPYPEDGGNYTWNEELFSWEFVDNETE